MTMMKTRFGGNAPGLAAGLLPAPLPSLSSAFSRRAALFGAVASAGFLAAAAAPAIAGREAGSADARLVAIANELHAIERGCNAHAALYDQHETDASEAEFEAMVARFGPLEEEMAGLQSDTLAGVLAKVRVLDIETCAAGESGIADSVCRDLRHLQAAGALA